MTTLALTLAPPPATDRGADPMARLRWLNLSRCLGQSTHSATLPAGLVQLRRWPDLAEVPDQFSLPVARLCALLSRTALPGEQIAARLGGDPQETLAVFQMLKALGYIDQQAAPSPGSGKTSAPPPCETHRTAPLSAGLATFMQRLREHLLG